MAEDSQTLRQIHWRELFPFLHLFRAFRVAIHPSKLFLGLLLVLLLYLGGRVLDAIWPTAYCTTAGEIDRYSAYQTGRNPTESFETTSESLRQERIEQYAALLRSEGLRTDRDSALEAARHGELYGDLQRHIIQHRNEAIDKANAAAEKSKTDIDNNKNLTEAERKLEYRRIADTRESEIQKAQRQAAAQIEELSRLAPRRIFAEFMDYEARQFQAIREAALTGNWLGGMSFGGSRAMADMSAMMAENALARNRTSSMPVSFGPVSVVQGLVNFAVLGPGWMVHYHFGYFILYAAWFLLVWAVFGGAIARIAAVDVSRDETISVRQALRFSTSKVVSFIFAPLIPLIIILIAGLVIAAGGLLLWIKVIGPIIVGAFFILALLAGFVMTLVVALTAGGFNVMYPTIAVEGTDSFDAISRSFSYVVGRPWKMLFYTVISLIYGSITFVFCRYFIFVMLSLTHFFAGWFLGGRPARYWPEIWPPVSDQSLPYDIVFPALAWSEKIAAGLISFWIYIILGLLAGFVVSFYFSSNTIIYLLIRREVDAAEMDDVYLEETDDDFSEASVATSAESAPNVETATPPTAPAPDAAP
ncbi:MAG TPA: hypothetical protein VH370_07240 [Humisphaera sp.]|nr:hypothetical protein [Humisphaera sp.]